MIEQISKTPEGFVDIPYFYVFDGTGLTNGTDHEKLDMPLQDDVFILRSVVGMETVAAKWLFRHASSQDSMSARINTGARYTVASEEHYPAQGEIGFELENVTRATNEDGNFVSYIGFQGVRRAVEGKAGGYYLRRTPYNYYEKPYSYVFSLDVDFYDDQGAAPKDFEVDVENYDFELQNIKVLGPSSAAIGADPFLFRLYDASGYYALASRTHPVRWVNYEQGGDYYSVFPCPTVVYPNAGRIRFEVESLIDLAGGSQTYELVFEGMSRIPC